MQDDLRSVVIDLDDRLNEGCLVREHVQTTGVVRRGKLQERGVVTRQKYQE